MTILNFKKEDKEFILSKENGRYDYFEFTEDKIKEIAKKDIKDCKWIDFALLVQMLYPRKLVCSGIFDCFILFDFKGNYRKDPPNVAYRDVLSSDSYNKQDKEILLDKFISIFKEHNIEYNVSWEKIRS